MPLEPRQWQCGSHRLPLDRTLIMGILNVTPDSFSDGGHYATVADAVTRALAMIAEGADIIDVGGESTRPGALPVSAAEEERRILPVIEELCRQTHVPLSVDTYKSGLAERALRVGACIINDISGLVDTRMAEVARDNGAGVVIMHIKGTPRDMQKDPHYEDVIREVQEFLQRQKESALRSGIKAESIVIDPGIGFGKRLDDNFTILRELDRFQQIGCPILVGPSRKSFIGTTLGLPVEQRLEGTAAAVAAAILHGADIVRVHDVQAMQRVATMCDRILGKRPTTSGSPANL
jgi:dihydropteroate synthase